MKRVLSLLLALLLTAVLFTGCGADSEEKVTPTPTQSTQPSDEVGSSEAVSDDSEDDGNTLPLAEGDVTFDVWWGMYEGAAPYISDLATNLAWSELIDRTGVNLHFISQPSSTESEQFNLMIASQDYPDIIKGAGTLYSGGIDKAIADGVYLRLNELIEKYAPNYLSRLKVPDDCTRDVTTDSGNMIFGQIYNRRQSGFFGPLIRQDWLNDLGLDVPATIAEWETVLTRFKDEKTSGSGPLQFATSGFNFGENFSGAFGVGGASEGAAMVLVDGKIQYSFLLPEMRDYLETMNRWYLAGLIDQEFTARGFLLYAETNRLANDELGAFISFFNQAGTFYKDNGVVTDEDFFLTLAPIPSLDKGTQPTVGLRMVRAAAGAGAVTTACEDPILAVKLLDYLYSDEGALLANYGIEGETFNYNEEGKPFLSVSMAK
jgi:putative aldouronate transport system substrate-binding protein